MACKSSTGGGLIAALVAAAMLHTPAQAQTATPDPTAAPQAALYEQAPKEKAVNRYAGSAIWRTEMVSPGKGLAPEPVVQADVTIPQRKLSMTWAIRRNSDTGLPATHVIEIIFKLPPEASKIVNISPTHMKQGENTPGSPLGGVGVKVAEGFFMIGLSNIEADDLLNRQLLAERTWLDIGFLYENGTRGMIALEKGDAGKRAFTDAFAAWEKAAAASKPR